MIDLPEVIRDTFLAAVPEEFLASVVRGLFQSYGAALQMCIGHMDAPETIDALSVNRRAVFEGNFRTAARRHDLAATVEVNPRKTSRFSLVKLGEIYITASRSKSMKRMPRLARYRQNYWTKAQSALFEIAKDATGGEARNDGALYAILLHGAPAKKKHKDDQTNLAFPSFARIVFPDEHGKILAGINLFTEIDACKEVINEYLPRVETVSPVVAPGLRPRKTKKKESETSTTPPKGIA
jgi:hypothetical protein